MSNLYEVSSLLALVMNRANNFSKVLGTLSHGTQIDIISISNGWAYFKYNNNDAYIKQSNLKVVNNQSIEIKGSITLKYIDNNTENEIYCSETLSNLALGSYTYEAKIIYGYQLINSSSQSISLTESNPNQTINFYYNQILGSITIKYIDKNTNSNISEPKVIENLSLGTYSYGFIEIYGYKLIDTEKKIATLTESTRDATITFNYEKILGSVTINYLDYSTLAEISPSITITNLTLDNYSYDAISIDNYEIVGDDSISVTLTSNKPDVNISFKYKNDLYVIELEKFNIFNNNTEAVKTTKGINDALIYAKEQGYKKVQLPAGNYLIENDNVQLRKTFTDIIDSTKTWTTNLKGIILPDNIIFDITGCTLSLQPNKYPEQAVINFANSHNSQLIGGTILGDRDSHLFELVINRNANELESGDFDVNTGLPIDDTTKMRTINYISTLEDGSPLPTTFAICPLANTSMNTVDGGCRYIYCYDKDNNYLGKPTGSNGFGVRATLPKNTSKIKVSFRGEKRTDAKYYMTTEKIYVTFEEAYGIRIYASDNVIINGTTVNNFLADGIITMSCPINHTNNNLNIINCTMENNRRQGMSFVGTTDGALLKGCKFGKTQGTDPQCGIDFEHYSYVKNIVIDDCDFYDNKKWDIINYNGWDIEIKNSRFNGGIGSTYGYNMNIHNNSFKYYNATWLDKTFKGGLFALYTNKTDADGAYFKIDNNIIEGYNSTSGNTTSSLLLSQFTNNKISNSSMVIGNNSYNNNYINSTIRYLLCNYVYTNETFNNCVIQGDNNGSNINSRYYDKFTMINCDFKGGNSTVVNTLLSNCSIYNNTKSFCNIWSGKYTLDNCNITTEYTSNISFIPSQGIEGVTFTNCTLNLSVTSFVGANYKSFYMNNCTITFNEYYKSETTVNFFKQNSGNGYFDNNKFYKSFSSPLIALPSSTNSTANNIPFTNSITI